MPEMRHINSLQGKGTDANSYTILSYIMVFSNPPSLSENLKLFHKPGTPLVLACYASSPPRHLEIMCSYTIKNYDQLNHF